MDSLEKLGSGNLTTVETTLYTVPTSTKTILKEIVLHNVDETTAKNVILKIDDVQIYNINLEPKQTMVLTHTAILRSLSTIKGVGEASYYMSGIEVN
jgi:hypothetical protein